ncbi:type II toxin-antitoxin system prevent-host-death family antitoxin [Eggerthella sp. YY7918]|uniref:type II toxin-antitoxin system prevent-host-death family antitoxin n=1 Tax=Eggerthella sp. (strain YY7918) TaxID=502558 RepID=UPI000217195A|nr:type II toxin-antitoxin system prevent-host-death family antitoxin [Eggerthella sp. YY7918]BAK45178.1 uncharacterized ACR [Eggerthella sp. YY7918]
MTMTAALPQIRPISDLRTRLNEIENLARETQEPIIMTKNGTASLVVIDSDAYNDHLQHERAVRKLREAEIEEKYRPEAVSYDDVKNRVDLLLEAVGHLDAHN